MDSYESYDDYQLVVEDIVAAFAFALASEAAFASGVVYASGAGSASEVESAFEVVIGAVIESQSCMIGD